MPSPTITNLAFGGATRPDGTALTPTESLRAGDTVWIDATMSSVVDANEWGALTMLLKIGDVASSYANYYSGSGTTNWRFAYTIRSSDVSDLNGISIPAGYLQSNSQNTAMGYAGLADNSAYIVNTVAPVVTGATPDLLASSDLGIFSTDNITSATRPTMRVNLPASFTSVFATGGKVELMEGATVLGTVELTQNNKGLPYVDIISSPLTAGTHALSARLTDKAGNAATSGMLNVTIDTAAPTISSVAITGGAGMQGGKLNAGDVVSVVVNMSEATVVSGMPQLALDIGGTTVRANYASGTGTKALVFTYTILAGQNDADGISIVTNGLNLNGGALRDAADNTANLAHIGAISNASYVVDTVGPKVSSVALTGKSEATYSQLNAGDTVSVTVKMSEATTVTGTPTVALKIGDTTVQAKYASGSGTNALVFTYAIQAGRTDSDGISIAANSLNLNGGTLRDAAGNTATLTHVAVTDNSAYIVDTAAPVATGATPDLLDISDNGSSSTDNITTAKTPTMRISLPASTGIAAGDKVELMDAGRSYVVFGKSDTTAIDLSAVANGSGGFVINGQASGNQSGISVSSAGDVNGDGLADLIVGSIFNVADPTVAANAGRSYVVFGKTGTTAIDLSAVAAGTGGFLINGQGAGDQSGSSVSSAGDVNGDGLADLIVGASLSDPAAGANAGRSYVIFGSIHGPMGPSAVDFIGTSADEMMSGGTAAAETFIGGMGNDTILGSGADVIYAGAGNDVISIDATMAVALTKPMGSGGNTAQYARISGGGGIDRLALHGADITLDLRAVANQGNSAGDGMSRLDSIEIIDLTGSGDNTLKLGVNDVLDITGMSNQLFSSSNGIPHHQLVVDGNAGDVVQSSGWGTSVGQATVSGNIYNVYDQGMARLLVDHRVTQAVI